MSFMCVMPTRAAVAQTRSLRTQRRRNRGHGCRRYTREGVKWPHVTRNNTFKTGNKCVSLNAVHFQKTAFVRQMASFTSDSKHRKFGCSFWCSYFTNGGIFRWKSHCRWVCQKLQRLFSGGSCFVTSKVNQKQDQNFGVLHFRSVQNVSTKFR